MAAVPKHVPVLLTEEEAAAILKLQPATLARRRVSRIDCPPYVKLSEGPKAPVRYEQDLLVDWIHAHRVAGT